MSAGFQLPGFQQSGFQTAQDDGSVVQVLPSLTQAATAFVDDTIDSLPSEVLGRAFLFRAPAIELGLHARIRSTLPALTQSATATVNDDELVLMLV